MRRSIPVLLFALLSMSCRHRVSPVTAARPAMPFVQLSPDRQSFVTADGAPFVVWGFNYDRDYKSRLIEEYWDDEWAAIASDFQEMKDLGANVVRVHLSVGHFMSSPDTPNQANLGQLARLLRLCERKGVYLDVTGLGCYRRQDIPAWYDALGEQSRWYVQANFWRAIARVCKDSPAVFCYDLMNEPLVPAGKRKPGEWMTGELGGFVYCQFITLDPEGRDRAQVARRWVREMVAAIRDADAKHLVTCGLLPNSIPGEKDYSGFDPRVVGPELDFVSTHLYPARGRLGDDVARLTKFDVGKPVVVEEIFPINCGAAEIGEFVDRTRSFADGWIGFYWGQTPADLTPPKSLGEALMLEWLKVFQARNPNGVRAP